MGLSLNQAFNIQRKATARLRDIYRTARHCGYDVNWIQKSTEELFTSLPKALSLMRRETLRNIKYVLHDEMMERDIEGVYLYKNLTFSINKTSKHHAPTSNISPKLLHDKNSGFAFFWIETGKQFTDWSKT